MPNTAGYIRIEGNNLCYTDNSSGKHKLPYDTGYSQSVGVDKKGYIRLEETDLLRIYYVDELGVVRRTEASESGGGNVGISEKGFMWVGENDDYLWFIGPNGDKRKITSTPIPIPVGNPLYFTSTGSLDITLVRIGTPNPVSLEISYDGSIWSDYTIGDTITLSNAGDNIYRRNKSASQTRFSTGNSNFYYFSISGSPFYAGGDVTTLLCQTGADTVYSYEFYFLFANNTEMLTPPELPATTVEYKCYYAMFLNCQSLRELPNLPATTLVYECYSRMFSDCDNIKVSETQSAEYTTPYRIPSSGTGTGSNLAMTDMFDGTSGTFAGTPNMNQTYYYTFNS